MPKTYLALTIGPTYATLNQARTTRELWLASYMLSKLAGIAIGYEGFMSPISPVLLSPETPTYGAGVYPDRVYWVIDKPLDKKAITSHNDAILAEMERACNFKLSQQDLKNAFRLIWVQATWTEEELAEKNFLQRLNDLLDSAELAASWEHQKPKDIITVLIDKGYQANDEARPIYKWRNESLVKVPPELNAYLHYGGVGRFPSIIEVTTSPLKRKYMDWYKENIEAKITKKLQENKPDDDEDLIKNIKHQVKDDFMASHKYLCIIQSDGDGVGTLLKNLCSNKDEAIEKLKTFSTCLNEFSLKASKMVVEYGGTPIFAGGDDLLFLAPVMHQEDSEKNIFHLLEAINTEFPKAFPTEGFATESLSQSFGLSITYYKHPLNEALKKGQSLLFEIAKNHEEKSGKKNAIAFYLQKHSGQYFEANLGLKGAFFKAFMELLNAYKKDDTRFLSSIMFQLREQKAVLAEMAHDTTRLSAFFNKNFDEKPHFENKDLLIAIEKLVHIQFKENPCSKDEELRNANLKRIFSCLKFIHFLRSKDSSEEDL